MGFRCFKFLPLKGPAFICAALCVSCTKSFKAEEAPSSRVGDTSQIATLLPQLESTEEKKSSLSQFHSEEPTKEPTQKEPALSKVKRKVSEDVRPPSVETVEPETRVNPADPVEAVVVPRENMSRQVSELKFEMGFTYFAINAQDKISQAESSLVSTMSPVLRATWVLSWTEHWQSIIGGSYRGEKIAEDSSAAPREIQNANGQSFGVFLGVGRQWSSSSRSELSLQLQDYIFPNSGSGNSIIIDHVSAPSVKLSHEVELFRVNSASFGAAGSIQAIGGGRGSGYKTEGGYALGAKVFMKHELEKMSFLGSLQYDVAEQSSDLVKQREQNLGVMFGVSFSWGAGL